MLYTIQCTDRPGSAELRQKARPAHIEYVKANLEKLVSAGPILSDDGERMMGSLFIIEVADRAEAEAFSANDPYCRAGLFESAVIRRFRQVVPSERA
jgi:hypothetical protein